MKRVKKLKTLIEKVVFPNFVKRIMFLLFVICVCIITLVNYEISLFTFQIFIIFFISYLSVYFFNDLIDLEYDKKNLKENKLLARGIFEIEEYQKLFLIFLIFSFIISFLLPKIGFLILLIIFLNIVRSYTKNIFIRGMLLVPIEFLIFVIFWFSLTQNPLNISSIVLFLLASITYVSGWKIWKKIVVDKYLALFVFLNLTIFIFSLLFIFNLTFIKFLALLFLFSPFFVLIEKVEKIESKAFLTHSLLLICFLIFILFSKLKMPYEEKIEIRLESFKNVLKTNLTKIKTVVMKINDYDIFRRFSYSLNLFKGFNINATIDFKISKN